MIKLFIVRFEKQVYEIRKQWNTNAWNLDLGENGKFKEETKTHARATGGIFLSTTKKRTKESS